MQYRRLGRSGLKIPALSLGSSVHLSPTNILGASHLEQLQENLLAIGDTDRLTSETMDQIDALVGSRPQPFDIP